MAVLLLIAFLHIVMFFCLLRYLDSGSKLAYWVGIFCVTSILHWIVGA